MSTDSWVGGVITCRRAGEVNSRCYEHIPLSMYNLLNELESWQWISMQRSSLRELIESSAHTPAFSERAAEAP